MADYGADAKVVIAEADKFFDKAGCDAMGKLSVMEQLLVVLNALGLKREVSAYMAERQLDFSPEAEVVLQRQIAFVNAMDE